MAAMSFAISFVLITACVACSHGVKTVSTSPFRFLISDRVDLDVGDAQAVNDMEPPPGSINEFGYYLSPRFFLASGETIQVVITADAPVALTGAGKSTPGGLQTGLNSIGEEDEPTTNIDLSYFTVATSTSAGGEWQLVYTFPAARLPSAYWQVPSGYYQLNVFNASGQAAHFEYSILLKTP
jgi:hypothetical protein